MKTDKANKVRYLQKATIVDLRISRNNDEIKALRNMKASEAGEDSASWPDKVEERIRELESENAHLMEVREQVINTINSLRDLPGLDSGKAEKYILILNHRYINGRTWPEIGSLLSYVPRHVREIHDDAIALIKLPEDERPP